MTILYDGKITGSNIARDFIEGNLEGNVWEIWNNGFQRYRNRDWLKKDDCASCGEWDYCKGGPMHLRLPDGTLLSCLYQTLNGNFRKFYVYLGKKYCSNHQRTSSPNN